MMRGTLIGLVLLVSAPVVAQPLCALPVSAYLTDADGTPLDGALDVELRFYLEADAGVPTECRSFSEVAISNGWMRIPVDACAPPEGSDCGTLALADIMRGADGLWVGVQVDGGELGPRIPVGAVPFAVQASDATTLQGSSPDAFEPTGAIADHAADPDAHHSSTSDGIHITPGSVTVGDTVVEDGEVDFGAAADDELTAEMVQTLTGGGDADALHMHPAGHGSAGGGCYVAWGVQTCGEGYAPMYPGTMMSDVTAWGSGVSSTPLCVADSAIESTSDTVTWLTRQLMTSGTGGRAEAPALTTDRLLCAVCCP